MIRKEIDSLSESEKENYFLCKDCDNFLTITSAKHIDVNGNMSCCKGGAI